MVEARVAEPERDGRNSRPRLLRGAWAPFADLRLLDGRLVLRVSRDRETVQIAVTDGAAFDPARSAVEVRMHEAGRARRR